MNNHYSFQVPLDQNCAFSQIPVLCIPALAFFEVDNPFQIPPDVGIPCYILFDVNSPFPAPVGYQDWFQVQEKYVLFDVNSPFPAPVGYQDWFQAQEKYVVYYPFASSHHDHVSYPNEPYQDAETNDQSLNNRDQHNRDWLGAQEEHVGHHPSASSHHDPLYHPNEPYQDAETNDQFLNNRDQHDRDWLQAQEEYVDYHPSASSHHDHVYYPNEPYQDGEINDQSLNDRDQAETNDQSFNDRDQHNRDWLGAQEEYVGYHPSASSHHDHVNYQNDPYQDGETTDQFMNELNQRARDWLRVVEELAGHHPSTSSHHDHVYFSQEPYQNAETNDQSNNLDQHDQGWLRAQEEYEYNQEVGFEDEDEDEDEDEGEGDEREWYSLNFDPEQYWLDLPNSLRENTMNFRNARRSEFYSSNFPDDYWQDFHSTPHGGPSEDTIREHLKTRSVNPTTDDDHETLCVVCQDLLFQNEDKIATLDCGHEYHQGCIKNWLMRKNSCPLCNAPGIG